MKITVDLYIDPMMIERVKDFDDLERFILNKMDHIVRYNMQKDLNYFVREYCLNNKKDSSQLPAISSFDHIDIGVKE